MDRALVSFGHLPIRTFDRDRAVYESGNQVAVFGRRGARPFTLEEMRRLYLRGDQVWTVSDAPNGSR